MISIWDVLVPVLGAVAADALGVSRRIRALCDSAARKRPAVQRAAAREREILKGAWLVARSRAHREAELMSRMAAAQDGRWSAVRYRARRERILADLDDPQWPPVARDGRGELRRAAELFR